MKILTIDKLDDCFDGSLEFIGRFDKPWTRETIRLLRLLGRLDYFPDFPRPFFRLVGKNGFQAKGVEGDSTCRLILRRENKEEQLMEFKQLFAVDDG